MEPATIATISACVLAGVFAFFSGCAVGELFGKQAMRQRAVAVGAARWVADEDGAVEFEWNVPGDTDADDDDMLGS